MVYEEGFGNGGDNRISTGSLSIANAAQLDSSTFGQGDAGDVIIQARDTVLFTGADGNLPSGILSTSEREGRGNSGNISITTGEIVVSDGAELRTITLKQGNAGDITIQARDQATLTNGSRLFSSTGGRGDAGNINIQAGDRVTLDNNAFVFSTIDQDGIGTGGDIRITAGELSITNRSGLSSSTLEQGSAGNISTDVRNLVSLDNNSLISSGVGSKAKGNSGTIHINAGSLSVTNDSELSASTEGQGNAGDKLIGIQVA